MSRQQAAQLPEHPSIVVCSTSGGKDSWHALLKARERFGRAPLVAHYQRVLDEWVGTEEYVQRTCDQLGVPLFVSQAHYTGMICGGCGHRHITINVAEAYCHTCGARANQQQVCSIDSIGDMVRWRGKWPGQGFARWCTAKFKSTVFDRWARESIAMLGDFPVLVMGERWKESRERARLPEVEHREGLVRPGWMVVWHPILDAGRIDSFQSLLRLGVEAHYCYTAQWSNMLRLQHKRWVLTGKPPHESFAGQWEGLALLDHLPDDLLAPMVETLMYRVREEGGPRCSCVRCIYKDAEQIEASYMTVEGRPAIEEGMEIEDEVGHSIHHHETLRQMANASRSWERRGV